LETGFRDVNRILSNDENFQKSKKMIAELNVDAIELPDRLAMYRAENLLPAILAMTITTDAELKSSSTQGLYCVAKLLTGKLGNRRKIGVADTTRSGLVITATKMEDETSCSYTCISKEVKRMIREFNLSSGSLATIDVKRQLTRTLNKLRLTKVINSETLLALYVKRKEDVISVLRNQAVPMDMIRVIMLALVKISVEDKRDIYATDEAVFSTNSMFIDIQAKKIDKSPMSYDGPARAIRWRYITVLSQLFGSYGIAIKSFAHDTRGELQQVIKAFVDKTEVITEWIANMSIM